MKIIEEVQTLDEETTNAGNHAVILTQDHNPNEMGVGVCDEFNNILAVSIMSLPTAEEFGKAFFERYNDCLRRARNEQ